MYGLPITSVYCCITFCGLGPKKMKKSSSPPRVRNVMAGAG